jgi:aminoglycoside/choline kinase family phosphotransferase
MDCPPELLDVRPFVRIGELLLSLDYSAPMILGKDLDAGFLLLEDLGDRTYTRCLAEGADEVPLYELATDLLADLHNRLTPERLAAVSPFTNDFMLELVERFTDWFLPAATGRPTPEAAKTEFLDIWRALLLEARRLPETLVLRDYHVDNLMLLEGRSGLAACGLIDFQDAVVGPPAFDLMSLVEDARRDVPADLAQALIARYLAQRPGIDPDAFRLSLVILAAQRHTTVIGGFCRLARRDGKPGYLRHLPRLWRLLSGHLAHPALGPLKAWMDEHAPPELRIIPKSLTHPPAEVA